MRVQRGLIELQTPTSSLLTGLLAWWKLDETTGTRLDSHTGARHLTLVGTGGYTASGKIGNAWDSIAAAGHLSNTSSVFNFLDTACTIAGWIYVTTWASNSGICGKWTSGNAYVIATPPGSPYNRLNCGASAGYAIATGLPTSTWFHLIFTHDPVANQVAVYINNGSAVTTALSGGFPTSSGAFNLAAYQDTYRQPCRLDEWAVWNRVITSTERGLLYNSGAGMTYPTA